MLLCLGITAVVCLSVTVFSFQSKVNKTTRFDTTQGREQHATAINLLLQVDVTSYQGVLFSMCMAMLLCAITLSIVVPFGYVSRVPLLGALEPSRAVQK